MSEASPAEPSLPPGAPLLLLVDPDALVRRVMHRVLTRDGYAVLTMARHEHARQVLAARAVQAVIVDVDPGRPADRAFLEELTTGWPLVPLIVTSSLVVRGFGPRTAPASPRRAFLLKPYRGGDMVLLVRRVLAAAEAWRRGEPGGG